MDSNLIFDVGMHKGNDAEFYLKKGFRVVAIEADPVLAQLAKDRLAEFVADGRLVVLNKAISDNNGVTEFYTCRSHDDWGTTSAEFVQRNEEVYGEKHEKIVVECTRMEDVLAEYGVPYYMKVDIEGADDSCLRALAQGDDRPRYVSIEPDQLSLDGMSSELAILSDLGYRSFKLVNQAQNNRVTCPKPAREGRYVDYRFNGMSSGPFGEEAPGDWLSASQLERRYRKILKLQSLVGTEGGWRGRYCDTFIHRVIGVYLKWIDQYPLGWYDIHAKIADG